MVASHKIEDLGLSACFTIPRDLDVQSSDGLSDNSDLLEDSREGCTFEDPRAAPIKEWLESTIRRINFLVYPEDLLEPDFDTGYWRL
ncbi:hypothetical protein FRC11_002669, partial [Ceratobasidium sp. 423]